LSAAFPVIFIRWRPIFIFVTNLKIVLLNQAFHPDVVSTAQHLSELAAELAARGHEVTVVTGRNAYDNSQKFFPAREIWRGAGIFRVRQSRAPMPAAPDDFSAFHQHRADHRIRRSRAVAALCQLQS
jgi:hypothetical protein